MADRTDPPQDQLPLLPFKPRAITAVCFSWRGVGWQIILRVHMVCTEGSRVRWRPRGDR